MLISEIKFTSSGPGEKDAGLLGWVACSLNGTIRLDGLALRKTVDDRLTLSFPARRDSAGHQHFFVRPLSHEARLEIQSQIFSALGIDQEPTR